MSNEQTIIDALVIALEAANENAGARAREAEQLRARVKHLEEAKGRTRIEESARLQVATREAGAEAAALEAQLRAEAANAKSLLQRALSVRHWLRAIRPLMGDPDNHATNDGFIKDLDDMVRRMAKDEWHTNGLETLCSMDAFIAWRKASARKKCPHGLTEWDGPCAACAATGG